MSDHLARLASRALKTLPTLQPRIPSRFETAQTAAPAAFDAEQHSVTFISNTTGDHARVPRSKEPSASNLVPQNNSPHQSFATAQPSIDEASIRPVPKPSAAHLLPSELATDVDTRKPTPPSPAIQVVPAVMPVPPATTANAITLTSTSNMAPSSQLANTDKRLLTPMLDSQPQSSSVPVPVVDIDHQIADHQSDALNDEIPLRATVPNIMPTHRERQPDRMSTAAVPSPPVIQISIGRIEVRGHAPTQPIHRPASKGPVVMSLDDYLRQRNKDER